MRALERQARFWQLTSRMRLSAGRSPAHKNPLLVAGLALLVLGTGNWIAGEIRARPYVVYLRDNPAPSAESRDLKASLLEPEDEEREHRDIARAKLDFYELVQTGGRILILAGVLCLGVAIVRLRATSGRGRTARLGAPDPAG